jgi:hypothetical protein
VPRARRAATRRDKQTAEMNRMPPGSQTSADAVKAGHRETFATRRGLASESVMRRETEPMSDASSDVIVHQRESGWIGRRAGGVLDGAWDATFGDVPISARQQSIKFAVIDRQNPHGVKSVSKTDKWSLIEPKNFFVVPQPAGERVIEAIDDRNDEGQSPRSSPRAGKPHTWRRGTVNRGCKQEVGLCPTR